MNESNAKKIIEHYLGVLQSEGIKVSKPEKAGYCYESELKSGSEKMKIRVYFGQKGVKTVLQGNKSALIYKKAEEVIFGAGFFSNSESKIDEPGEYIGTDESGKGDFFGPLVIAGVYIKKDEGDELRRHGIRDSKLIPDNLIGGLAEKIRRITSDRSSVVFISPLKYNELYSRLGNLNKLLAWGHSRVIENILEKFPADVAVSDKFGDERLIKDSLMEKGRTITLHQFHKAESYTAVAAASILARNEVNNWFITNRRKYNIEIPKGASEAVEKTAVIILEKFGPGVLGEITKVHFKTTKKITGI